MGAGGRPNLRKFRVQMSGKRPNVPAPAALCAAWEFLLRSKYSRAAADRDHSACKALRFAIKQTCPTRSEASRVHDSAANTLLCKYMHQHNHLPRAPRSTIRVPCPRATRADFCGALCAPKFRRSAASGGAKIVCPQRSERPRKFIILLICKPWFM